MLTLFVLFFIKHFICDFILQTKYQYSNKGTLGHPGGLLHVFIHLVGTSMIVLWWNVPDRSIIIPIMFMEGSSHYLMDWLKVNINLQYGWGPLTSEYYWWLLGFDQLVHSLVYVLIIYSMVNM